MLDTSPTAEAETPRSLASRRAFIKAGGAAVLAGGAVALAACESSTSTSTSSSAAAGGPSATSVLDTWIQTKTARLGVDLTFPPIQFKDPATGEPTGYQMDLTKSMMADLGVTPKYVEIPFGQLFAGLAAGKFDMMGISATILPSRALKGLFAGIPTFYEGNVVMLKPGSTITSQDQLNSPNVKFALLQGSSQEFSAKLLFPKAQFSAFGQVADAANEVAAGRADAILFSEFEVAGTAKAHPDMKVLSSGAVFVDANAYFMPLNDFKLYSWVTNWVRYQATHHILEGLWNKWVANDVRAKFHLPATVVGPAGEPITLPGL